MKRCLFLFSAVLGLFATGLVAGEPAAKMTSQDLADWIDQRFADEYQKAGTKLGALVDDATYLRRVSLDLQGRIPTVAQLRDFLAEESSFKRQDYVDRLLTSEKRPEQFAQRSADHLARVWRRMMVPRSSTENQATLSRGLGGFPATQQPMTPDPDAVAGVFQQAVGQSPENLAAAYVRVFLGVRLHCAQCHDHPLADWKRTDFWGIAALLSPADAKQAAAAAAPVITPGTEQISYKAKLLWTKEPLKEIPAGKSSRELLADWMFSKENPNFAATAVNRVWQYLCGRGLAGSDAAPAPLKERG